MSQKQKTYSYLQLLALQKALQGMEDLLAKRFMTHYPFEKKQSQSINNE